MQQLNENCYWPCFYHERWFLITPDWYSVIDLTYVILWVTVNAGYQEQFTFLMQSQQFDLLFVQPSGYLNYLAWYHNSVRWTLNRWPESNSNAKVTHYVDAILSESNCEIIVFEALSSLTLLQKKMRHSVENKLEAFPDSIAPVIWSKYSQNQIKKKKIILYSPKPQK